MLGRKLYADKATRDAAYREAKSAGRNVTRGTVRGQQLHPMYIEDVPSGNTGFGNTEYLTLWPTLYVLKEEVTA